MYLETGGIMSVVATIRLPSDFAPKFKENVIREIVAKIKKVSPAVQEKIAGKIKKLVRMRLLETPEYQSIIAGKLRGELGIPDSSARIAAVVDTWVNGIEVKMKTGRSPLLSIDIGVIKSDYGDVLSLVEATYTYSGRRGEGEIPWLEWLLLEGDRRIVNRYEFSSNITRGSRTGMGIMISKKRGFWQVPPEYSGTEADNFATRALGNIETEIDHIVKQAIQGALA